MQIEIAPRCQVCWGGGGEGGEIWYSAPLVQIVIASLLGEGGGGRIHMMKQQIMLPLLKRMMIISNVSDGFNSYFS